MTTPRPSSPCIGICRVERGYCVGCLRTLSEIAAWSSLSEAERLRIMHDVLPARRAMQRENVPGEEIENSKGGV